MARLLVTISYACPPVLTGVILRGRWKKCFMNWLTEAEQQLKINCCKSNNMRQKSSQNQEEVLQKVLSNQQNHMKTWVRMANHCVRLRFLATLSAFSAKCLSHWFLSNSLCNDARLKRRALQFHSAGEDVARCVLLQLFIPSWSYPYWGKRISSNDIK